MNVMCETPKNEERISNLEIPGYNCDNIYDVHVNILMTVVQLYNFSLNFVNVPWGRDGYIPVNHTENGIPIYTGGRVIRFLVYF